MIETGTVYRFVQAGRQVTDVAHCLFLFCNSIIELVRLVLSRRNLAGPNLPLLNIDWHVGLRNIFERLFSQDGRSKLYLAAPTKHPLSIGTYEPRGGVGPRPQPKKRQHPNC